MTEEQYKVALKLLIHGNMQINEDNNPFVNFGGHEIILKNINARKVSRRRILETFLEVIEGKLQYTVD